MVCVLFFKKVLSLQPKWKLEEQAKQEREKKARDEFAAQKKKERELEEEEGRKRAEEADRLLATGQVKSTGKNQLRTRVSVTSEMLEGGRGFFFDFRSLALFFSLFFF